MKAGLVTSLILCSFCICYLYNCTPRETLLQLRIPLIIGSTSDFLAPSTPSSAAGCLRLLRTPSQLACRMLTDGEIPSSKDVRVISSWSCATDPTKDLVDFARIHPDGGLFQIAEDDYLDELVGPETGFLLEDRSVAAGSSMHCPLQISCTRDLVGLLGVIVITNCEVIEVYGSLNAGYIQTSRGILLEKVDETAFYSHTLNFTKGPLLEIELKMVNKSAEKRFVTFFALHVYLTHLTPSPRKALNDPSMLALFSGLMSAPATIGQGDGMAAIAQEKDKMDKVRTEMQLMEQRLTTHIDKQFEDMKKEIAKQFDQLLLRMHQPDPKS